MSTVRTQIVNYFKARMPTKLRNKVNRAWWNLYEFGGPISDDCNVIRAWMETASVYYYPQDAEDAEWTGYIPLYSRPAKGRERLDAIDFKSDILPRGLGEYV